MGTMTLEEFDGLHGHVRGGPAIYKPFLEGLVELVPVEMTVGAGELKHRRTALLTAANRLYGPWRVRTTTRDGAIYVCLMPE